jgi:quercetin dioxygenase-like cupin family protein
MPKPLTLPLRDYSREEMQARIARFADLKGFSSGFRDNVLPNTLRTLINVIGFDAPKEGFGSPVGADASRASAIQIQEGFNLAYVRCKPGNGPVMHNHDTNETFVPMTGRWRCSWNEENTQSADLDPLDVISFPPGVARRFENITQGEADKEHVLMVIVAGTAPGTEITLKAQETIEKYETMARQ